MCIMYIPGFFLQSMLYSSPWASVPCERGMQECFDPGASHWARRKPRTWGVCRELRHGPKKHSQSCICHPLSTLNLYTFIQSPQFGHMRARLFRLHSSRVTRLEGLQTSTGVQTLGPSQRWNAIQVSAAISYAACGVFCSLSNKLR